MVFNSAAFLFMFLPVALILYWLIPGRGAKNALLCLLSLVFYAFGGPAQIPVLLFSAVWTFVLGLPLAKESGPRRLWLWLGVAGNLGLLCYYKYLGFFLGILGVSAPGRSLPLGISFFTFHAISYLADSYRDPSLAERRFGGYYDKIPPKAVTIGMKSILSSKRMVCMLRMGSWKQTVLRIMLLCKDTTLEYPVTFAMKYIPEKIIYTDAMTLEHPLSK